MEKWQKYSPGAGEIKLDQVLIGDLGRVIKV